MIKRVISDVVLFLSIFFAPWYWTAVLAILFIILFPKFWEAIAAALFLDAMYYFGPFTISALILFIVIEKIKTQIRI